MCTRSCCISRSRSSIGLESGMNTAGRITSATVMSRGAGRVIGPPHKVFQETTPRMSSTSSPTHRHPGVTAADRQRGGLRRALVALDPDHLGARDHDLAGRGVAEFEDRLIIRRSPRQSLATTPRSWPDRPPRAVRSRGERPVAEATAGRQRCRAGSAAGLIGVSSTETPCSGTAHASAIG